MFEAGSVSRAPVESGASAAGYEERMEELWQRYREVEGELERTRGELRANKISRNWFFWPFVVLAVLEIDRVFQAATYFIGASEMRNYTSDQTVGFYYTYIAAVSSAAIMVAMAFLVAVLAYLYLTRWRVR